ncbi:MAG: hypothetical protein CND86_05905 [Bacteroidetes bacterium MED-G21]|nr:MAG: hypothetical protein CND86_05905 [Bacteroidetes bacterium MED-G21]
MKKRLFILLFLPIALFGQEITYEEIYVPQFLPEGWSLIGFNCIDSSNVIEAFNPILDKVEIIKDYIGNAYLPDWGFNGIGNLIYPRGYQVKLSEEILNFSFCSTIIKTINQEVQTLPEGQSYFTVTQNIDNQLVDRSVFIKAPENINTENSLPVVFMFHGAGGNGESYYNNPFLNELIADQQFVGVYPNGHMENGINGYWNLGSEPTNANDVEFIEAIIDSLNNYSSIDSEKVYAIGMSNGGGIVNLLGKTTDIFKGIAPLFSQQLEFVAALEPISSLSVFQVNGINDGLIPINGGITSVGVFLSAENSALNWADSFNCDNIPIEEELLWANTTISSKNYNNCIDNNQVQSYYAHDTQHGFNSFATNEIAILEIWQFFQSH